MCFQSALSILQKLYNMTHPFGARLCMLEQNETYNEFVVDATVVHVLVMNLMVLLKVNFLQNPIISNKFFVSLFFGRVQKSSPTIH